MAGDRNRTFVLVHGSWHGGWCWRRVSDRLTTEGHRVFTPTLTGLADRSHLMSAGITLDTHITDIVNVFRWEEIENAILVGHSYAGWVISGALEKVHDRVAAAVFLDAFLPENGDRGYDYTRDANRRGLDEALAKGAVSRPPPPAAAFGIQNPADVAWVEPRLTPQPVSVSLYPIQLGGRREMVKTKLYIRAPRYEQWSFDKALAKCQADSSWRTMVIEDCSHDVMVDAAPRLADILLGLAVE